MLKAIVGFAGRYVYAALSCLYLFTAGVLRARNRLFISDICTHFGYTRHSPIIPPELADRIGVLPKVDVSSIVPDDTAIHIHEPIEADGNISTTEIVVINKLIRTFHPAKVFEIGTFDGRTALNMAANCPPEAEIHTLDLPADKSASTKLRIVPGEEKYIEKQGSRLRYPGTSYESKITQWYGDSADFDFSPFFNQIDFVFVDGSHSYEYVLNDSGIAIQLLRDGHGVILWHDYGVWRGVTKALDELYSGAAPFENLRHIDGTSLVILLNGE